MSKCVKFKMAATRTCAQYAYVHIRHHGSDVHLGMSLLQNGSFYLTSSACRQTSEMVVKRNNSSPWISLFQGEEHAACPIATCSACKGKVL